MTGTFGTVAEKKKLTNAEKNELVRKKRAKLRAEKDRQERERQAAHERRMANAGSGSFLAKKRRKEEHEKLLLLHAIRRETATVKSGGSDEKLLELYRKKYNFSADTKLALDRKTGNIMVTSPAVVKDGKVEVKGVADENDGKGSADPNLPGGGDAAVGGVREPGDGQRPEEPSGDNQAHKDGDVAISAAAPGSGN